MTNTLQQIKDEWAKDYGYIDYKEFYELTRVVDADQVFIMDGAVNQVAKRYAQEQKRELVEMLEMVVMDLEERGRAYGDIYTMSKNLITKHKQL